MDFEIEDGFKHTRLHIQGIQRQARMHPKPMTPRAMPSSYCTRGAQVRERKRKKRHITDQIFTFPACETGCEIFFLTCRRDLQKRANLPAACVQEGWENVHCAKEREGERIFTVQKRPAKESGLVRRVCSTRGMKRGVCCICVKVCGATIWIGRPLSDSVLRTVTSWEERGGEKEKERERARARERERASLHERESK